MFWFGLFDCAIFVMIIAYIIFRLYVWSCYRQFVWMTMAELNGRKFPISNADLKTLVKECHAAVDGTGINFGTPCRPNYEQTLQVCEGLPDANRPEAFVGMVFDLIGVKIKGITCFHGICQFRNSLINYDMICAGGALGLIIFTRIMKCMANQCVKNYKRSIQKTHGQEVKEFRDRQNLQRSGGYFTGSPRGGYSSAGMGGYPSAGVGGFHGPPGSSPPGGFV
jgi:hypothetical protein